MRFFTNAVLKYGRKEFNSLDMGSITGITLLLVAILIWSSQAVAIAKIGSIYSGLIVFYSSIVSFLIGVWKVDRSKLNILGVVFTSMFFLGYQYCLLTSFKLAPIPEANSIQYLWTLLIVVFSPLYFAVRLDPVFWINLLLLSISGTVIFWESIGNFTRTGLAGYVFAAVAAITWANYSLMAKKYPNFFNFDNLTVSFLIIGLVGMADTSNSGLSLIPTLADDKWPWFLFLIIGRISYFFWDSGVKRVSTFTVARMALLTPILSSTLLAIFVGVNIGWNLWIAFSLSIFGPALTHFLVKSRE